MASPGAARSAGVRSTPLWRRTAPSLHARAAPELPRRSLLRQGSIHTAPQQLSSPVPPARSLASSSAPAPPGSVLAI